MEILKAKCKEVYKQWQSVKTKTTVISILLFVVSILTLTLIAEYSIKSNLHRFMAEQQGAAASAAAKQLEEVVHDRVHILELVANSLTGVSEKDHKIIQKNIDERPAFLSHFNGGVFVLGTDGVSFADTEKERSRIGQNFLDRAYILSALRKNKTEISSILLSKVDSTAIFSIASPIHGVDGSVTDVIVGVTRLTIPNFLDSITSSKYGKSGELLLVSRETHQVISSSNKNQVMKELPVVLNLKKSDFLFEKSEGSAIFQNEKGVDILATSKEVGLSDWILVATSPLEYVNSPINETLIGIRIITSLIVIISGLLIWYLLYVQLSPLSRATEAVSHLLKNIESENIESEKIQPLTLPILSSAKGKDEISVLLNKFNSLLQTLGQRDLYIKSIKDDLQEAQRMALVGSWSLDLLTNQVTWTKELYEMQGLDPSKPPPTYNEHSKLFTPESWKLLSTELENTAKTGQPYELELEMTKPNGQHGWMLARGEAVRNEKNEIVKMKGIAVDITSRRKFSEMEAEKAKADAAALAKTQFLANMSHEIRTPLNAIIGITDILSETKLDNDQRKYLEVFRRAGENLINIINDILDMTKLDANSLNIRKSEFELKAILEEVYLMFQNKAAERNIDFRYSIAPDLNKKFIGDFFRIKQVLVNLVGNSLKFTHEGSIFLSARINEDNNRKGNLFFQVIDSGIGISELQQKKLFQSFVQADSSATKRYGGTGLGLVISKNLIELMGGEIWLNSKEGAGTTISFTVDCAPHNINVEKDSEKQKEALDTSVVQFPTEKLKILLVDDSEDNRILIHAFLKGTPYLIVDAENGKVALEIAKNDSFDVILMDMQMPVMNGYDATRAIRDWEGEKEKSHTFIAAVTAYALTEDVEQSRQAGCDYHLSKPLKKKDLAQLLSLVASRQKHSDMTQP